MFSGNEILFRKTLDQSVNIVNNKNKQINERTNTTFANTNTLTPAHTCMHKPENACYFSHLLRFCQYQLKIWIFVCVFSVMPFCELTFIKAVTLLWMHLLLLFTINCLKVFSTWISLEKLSLHHEHNELYWFNAQCVELVDNVTKYIGFGALQTGNQRTIP